MKRLLYAIRMWLIEKLGGVDMRKAVEWEARAEAKANEYYKGQLACYRDIACDIEKQRRRLYKVIREICRRSENSYYDWCCEYCTAKCDRRSGWCERFDA